MRPIFSTLWLAWLIARFLNYQIIDFWSSNSKGNQTLSFHLARKWPWQQLLQHPLVVQDVLNFCSSTIFILYFSRLKVIKLCWWLVRVTLVVAWWFFAPKFWEVAGTYESSFFSKVHAPWAVVTMWGGGDTKYIYIYIYIFILKIWGRGQKTPP